MLRSALLFGSALVILIVAASFFVLEHHTNSVSETSAGDTVGEIQSGSVVVTLTDEGYTPSEFTITTGTEVVFNTNRNRPHWPASNLHPTHEQYPEFDPGAPVEPDEAWSFVFLQPGLWHFHDHIRSYYTGTIHVITE